MSNKNKSEFNIKDAFVIPNILCYIRIILIPIFVITYLKATDLKDYYVASAIIILSGLTDFADGYIARRFNMVTEIGKLIDPVADKLSQAAILLVLMIKIEYMYLFVILFVIKELFMAINKYVLFRRGKKLDVAQWYGKVSTAVFYVAMVVIILMPTLGTVWVNTLVVISAGFMILSLVMYGIEFNKMYKVG